MSTAEAVNFALAVYAAYCTFVWVFCLTLWAGDSLVERAPR